MLPNEACAATAPTAAVPQAAMASWDLRLPAAPMLLRGASEAAPDTAAVDSDVLGPPGGTVELWCKATLSVATG